MNQNASPSKFVGLPFEKCERNPLDEFDFGANRGARGNRLEDHRSVVTFALFVVAQSNSTRLMVPYYCAEEGGRNECVGNGRAMQPTAD